ncbi:hypothetical protein Ancab_030097 [Ancistrocladus abbreviatus]
MQLCSYSSSSFTSSSSPPSSSNPTSSLFSPSHNPKFSPSSRKIPIKSLLPLASHLTLPPCSSSSKELSAVLQEPPNYGESDELFSERGNEEQLLVVRRPVMELSGEEEEEEEKKNVIDEGSSEEEEEEEDNDDGGRKEALPIDASLEKFAKKLGMFEPSGGRGESGPEEKPLSVNLDLALYRVKILTRNYQYQDAEDILQKCIYYWPDDGRPYVALGKVLRKQGKIAEARAVYEKGCQATQGENAYIWQCWADLENKIGSARKARELFDAATVADKRHIAAWHGWAVLELKQGNIKKARSLLGKALKYCGGNEYVYQTLALLESKANRYEQARYLFRQATKCNPKSCASWLAWAQLEMQQENNRSARQLFEKAVQASPKNRFAWHVWGLFEANLGNIDKARKLLKIGHLVNPKDSVLLQSLALLEYKHSTANFARVLFRRASELDPSHQPVWIAWGVLEQRVGNFSAARRLFRSSLNINSQSYITWMTWASMEENQGNPVRAEEIRNLYFQQRTEVVDDASWVLGFLDIIDPALDSIKRLLNLDQNSFVQTKVSLENMTEAKGEGSDEGLDGASSGALEGSSGFDLDKFIKEKLSIDPSKLDGQMEASLMSIGRTKGIRKLQGSRLQGQ